MKIIHITSGGDKGGAKTHLLALAKELVKYVELKIVCFIEGDFYQEAKKQGLPVVLIKQKRRTDTLFSKDLINFIESEKPDVIHSHGARANFSVFLNRRKIKKPLITTIHSDYKLDFKDTWYKNLIFTLLNEIALRKFDYYIGVSPEFKRMLVERGYEEEDIFSVYNGIDFSEKLQLDSKEEFIKKYKLESIATKKVVGNISRLEMVKGVDVFIQGAYKVLKKEKDVHFVIAGDGTQSENLKKMVDELNIQENVTFLGFIDDVTSLLNIIDINVITSHSESFTYSLLEGARQKKASIASKVGGLPELIKHEKTGLLFDDNDIEKLSDNILELLWEDEKREKLGENLYNYAKENFSTDAMVKKHLEIYNEVIRRGK